MFKPARDFEIKKFQECQRLTSRWRILKGSIRKEHEKLYRVTSKDCDVWQTSISPYIRTFLAKILTNIVVPNDKSKRDTQRRIM